MKIIETKNQRILYLCSISIGSLIGAIGFVLWQGLGFLGIGLPFGFIVGLVLFLTYISLRVDLVNAEFLQKPESILVISALAGIIAHFIEINFGIAIVTTRIYFWIFAAIIIGYRTDHADVVSRHEVKGSKPSKFKRVEDLKRIDIFISSLIMGLILIILNYEYISNLDAETNVIKIIWKSFTQIGDGNKSAGVLLILTITWIIGSILVGNQDPSKEMKSTDWLKSKANILAFSLVISVIFCLVQAISLSNLAAFSPKNTNELILQASRVERLLTLFYISVGVILILFAYSSRKNLPTLKRGDPPITYIIAVIACLGSITLISRTNIKVIQADIAFKLAEPFAAGSDWRIANHLYGRAKSLAPDEDYYYLFLGRGYLEYAKTVSDEIEKEEIYNNAAQDLMTAQSINPLNTDHTANLARLNSWWALQTDDLSDRRSRGVLSEQNYNRAIVLSPNNARLRNELAILKMNIMGQPDEALSILEISKQIDPKYDWTYALTGDMYTRIAGTTETEEEANVLYELAKSNFTEAISLSSEKTLESPQGLNYLFALANLHQITGDIDQSILTLEESLLYASHPYDIWRIEQNLALLYYHQGSNEMALKHAYAALNYAPDEESEEIARIRELITVLENTP